MEKGFFGSMFDFNNDGKLDAVERSIDFAAFVDLMESDSESEEYDEDDCDEDF